MVAIFALAAAVLYGTADFLGGAASRRASALAVLSVTAPVGGLVVAHRGAGWPAGRSGWPGSGGAVAGGAAGGAGLIVFYAGLAAGPMSVVAPVSALVSTVLPVGVAVAQGERPGPRRSWPAPCSAWLAITLVSMEGGRPRSGGGARRRSAGSSTGSRPAPASACSSCSSATPGPLACSGRSRSPGWRARWSGWLPPRLTRTRPLGWGADRRAVPDGAGLRRFRCHRQRLLCARDQGRAVRPGGGHHLAVPRGDRPAGPADASASGCGSVQRAGLLLAAVGIVLLTSDRGGS